MSISATAVVANLTISCVTCNNDRGDRDYIEFQRERRRVTVSGA